MSTITIIPSTKAQQLHLRVAAYCRVSSDSADQLHSYAAQINAYTQLIQQHSDWELVDIYADEGLTGTRMDKRTEFGRLLSDCRKGRVDKILVKSISRFARNTKDCLVVLRELKLLNVSVQFEEEHIDTQTLTSELMVSVFGSLAQQESTSISQNLRMSYQRRMEKGAFSTCKAPFGYRLKDGKQLTIPPTEAASVSWIFSEYLRGRSQAQIAENLTRRGLPTADGTPYWQETSIAYILTNEKYIGDSLCQKTYTPPCPSPRSATSENSRNTMCMAPIPPLSPRKYLSRPSSFVESGSMKSSTAITSPPSAESYSVETAVPPLPVE